jgi:hypothetical protein
MSKLLIIDESCYISDHRDDDEIGRAALASITPRAAVEDCMVDRGGIGADWQPFASWKPES